MIKDSEKKWLDDSKYQANIHYNNVRVYNTLIDHNKIFGIDVLLSGATIEGCFYTQKYHSDKRVHYRGDVKIDDDSHRVSIKDGIPVDSRMKEPPFNYEFDKGENFEKELRLKCEEMVRNCFLNPIYSLLDKETIWLNRSAFGDAKHVLKITNWDHKNVMFGIELNGGNIVEGFNQIRTFNGTEAIPKNMKPSTFEKVEAFLMKNINPRIDQFIETLNRPPTLPYYRKL